MTSNHQVVDCGYLWLINDWLIQTWNVQHRVSIVQLRWRLSKVNNVTPVWMLVPESVAWFFELAVSGALVIPRHSKKLIITDHSKIFPNLEVKPSTQSAPPLHICMSSSTALIRSVSSNLEKIPLVMPSMVVMVPPGLQWETSAGVSRGVVWWTKQTPTPKWFPARYISRSHVL